MYILVYYVYENTLFFTFNIYFYIFGFLHRTFIFVLNYFLYLLKSQRSSPASLIFFSCFWSCCSSCCIWSFASQLLICFKAAASYQHSALTFQPPGVLFGFWQLPFCFPFFPPAQFVNFITSFMTFFYDY